MTSSPEGRQEAAVLDAKALGIALVAAEAEYMTEEHEGLAFDVAVTKGIRAYLSALPAPVASVPIVVFGEGKVVVDTGTAHGRPAVFIAPASNPGEVGASAAREGHDLHSLQPGEIVLTFPTDEQARAVEAALIPAKPAVEVVEALKAALDLAKLAETMTSCRGDDEYVWGVQAKIEAALAALQAPATPDVQTEVEK